MKVLFDTGSRCLDPAFLILRLGLSFVFIFAGIFKLNNPSAASMFDLPVWLFLLIGSFEVISGIGVLLGFLTRPSTVFQIVILLGAIFVVGGGNIANTQVPVALDAGLLAIPVALLLYGPGRYSLDAKLNRRH